jgi:hypothetical protein
MILGRERGQQSLLVAERLLRGRVSAGGAQEKQLPFVTGKTNSSNQLSALRTTNHDEFNSTLAQNRHRPESNDALLPRRAAARSAETRPLVGRTH